jgi:hypothetical protein
MPLDPNEEDRYNKSVDEDAHNYPIENIYKITGCREDYINPTLDGELSWKTVNSYDIDSTNTVES